MPSFVPISACFGLDARPQTECLYRCERRVRRMLHSFENVRRAGKLHLPHGRFRHVPAARHQSGTYHTGSAVCRLLDNLPVQPVNTAVGFGPETPLLDVFNHLEPSCGLQSASASDEDISTTIHSHVNRLLDRVITLDRVEQQLTSQSFCRGGAQHANSCAQLAARWIFDRGAWNVNTTNKAFNYVFNIMNEDHKVSNVLSGWKPFRSPT